MTTRYAILANPFSGGLSGTSRGKALETAAKILGARVYGLGTGTREEFALCAREVAPLADVLVVAGGDGTVSDVINAVDTSRMPIAYLPLGSGNALAYGLGYPKGTARVAHAILKGRIHEYDLIRCDGRKLAVLASVGMEGAVLDLRARFPARGLRGFPAYGWAFLRTFVLRRRPVRMMLDLDGRRLHLDKTLSLIIARHPYFGYGMKLLPAARPDDGALNILCIAGGFMKAACTVLTAFTVGNRLGVFLRGRKAVVRLDQPMALQMDGNLAWKADRFTFELLPKALRIQC